MRIPTIVLFGLLALLAWSRPAHAARSYDNCSGFITALPATISTSGTWCLNQDLTTAATSGSAITISADNVVLDCNDFRIDGLAAGSASLAVGVSAFQHGNVKVRHCNVRGFNNGVQLTTPLGGSYVVEDNHLDLNLNYGIQIEGDKSVARRNILVNTGQVTITGSPHGIEASAGTVDIIDNTIMQVSSPCSSTRCGIAIDYGSASTGGNIVGNHVEGYGYSINFSPGIGIYGNGRFDVRENQLATISNTSTGIDCAAATAPTVRVHDNVIDGFTTPLNNCTDAGENDITP